MTLPTTPEGLVGEFKKKPIKPETPEQREEGKKIIERVSSGKPGKYEQAMVEQPVQEQPKSREEIIRQIMFQRFQTEFAYQQWRRKTTDRLSSIDPTQTYYIPEYLQPRDTPGYTPSHRVVTGSQLISEIESGVTSTDVEYIKYKKTTKDVLKTVVDVPKGTKFIPDKKGGYTLDVPDTAKLKWSREAHAQTADLPPVYKEIAQFNLGAWSSIWALTKPVADIFGKGKDFVKLSSLLVTKGGHLPMFGLGIKQPVSENYEKLQKAGKYGVHYPSVFDVAFEPMGWSPKGSTEFLKKHPVYTAGAIGGEIAQSTAMVLPSQKIAKTTVGGLKKGIKLIPEITTKFKMPTFNFMRKIGETTVGKNIYRWGAKGWKKGISLASGTHIPKKVTSEVGEMVYKKVPYVHGQKIWMSPTQYEFAQKTLKSLLSKGGLDIGFPTVKTVEGGKEVVGIITHESYKLGGLFKPKITRVFGGIRTTMPIFKGSRLYWKGTTSKMGGISRKIGQRIWAGDTAITIKSGSGKILEKSKVPFYFPETVQIKNIATGVVSKKTIFTSGLKDVYIKPGQYMFGFRGSTQTVLKGLTTPLPKKWIKKTTSRGVPGLLSVGQLDQPKTVFRLAKGGGRTSLPISGGLVVPLTSMSMPVYGLGYGTVKITQLGTKQFQDTNKLTLPVYDQRKITFTGTSQITSPTTIQVGLSKQDELTVPVQTTRLVMTQKSKYETITVPKFKQTKPTDFNIKMPIVPWIPQIGLSGRGRMYYGEELWDTKYKFRKFELPNPLKGVKL